MSDNKELLTIAAIAAALMMVLGTSIPSNVLASTSIEAAPASDENGNDDTSNSDSGDGSGDNSNDNSDNNKSNDNSDNGSKDDSGNDENSDDSSGNNDSSDSNNEGTGGVPEEYLGEYSTCVSDLSSDDSTLSQDDVVDCYGQVFGPNPSHDLGPLTQNAPTSPATNMPGFENMPSAMQQPGDQQQMQPLGQTQPQDGQQPIQQQQSYPAAGDQQQMQPLGQTQPQDGQQQMQPLGQIQPQDGQQQPIQQQLQQPQTGMGNQQQMSPTELPMDAGILDVETIKEIVKHRLAQ